MSKEKVRVAILDDHQSIIDGYVYRLNSTPEIEVVATALFGEELESMLTGHSVDVLLIDLSVQSALNNPNPYPVLQNIPKFLQKYPDLCVLVISMYAGPGLMRMIMETGVNGYIMKDDQAAFKNLGNIVLSVADGEIYFGEEAYKLYAQSKAEKGGDLLTPRQLEALSLCAMHADLSTEDLAQLLAVTNSTARNLLSSAYLRLGVHSRIAAIEKARQLGLISSHLPI